MPRTIIFDLDGTLVHSAPDLAYALNLCLADSNLAPISVAQAETMIGNGMPKLLRRAFSSQGKALDDARFETEYAKFVSHYNANLLRETAPYPGAVDLLRDLKAADYRLAICTNKRQDAAQLIVDQLGLNPFFDAVVGSIEGEPRKPDATPLHRAIRLAGGTVDQALMVGDSKADADCAAATGIPCILVDFGYTTVPVNQLPNDGIISTLDALMPLLDSIFPSDSV